jgi:transaldolase
MKIFLDTADIDQIKRMNEVLNLDGVTTNPTLIMKSGRQQKEVIAEITRVAKGPVSVEGIDDTAEGMVLEGTEFAKWAPNVVVKIPMTKEGMKAVRMLSAKGIKTNVTLVFSPAQALLAAKAGAAYVSPFVGRLDDINEDGMKLVADILQVYRACGYKTEVIVASVRSVRHVVEAAKLGAHIATIPASVFEEMFKHPLTDKGIAQFKEDYKKTAAQARK